MITSKAATKEYCANYESIFGKKVKRPLLREVQVQIDGNWQTTTLSSIKKDQVFRYGDDPQLYKALTDAELLPYKEGAAVVEVEKL